MNLLVLSSNIFLDILNACYPGYIFQANFICCYSFCFFFHLKDSLYLFLFLANPLTFANIIVLSVCLYFFLKNFNVRLVFIHKAIFAFLFPHHLYHT